jgi:hypothetical protein
MPAGARSAIVSRPSVGRVARWSRSPQTKPAPVNDDAARPAAAHWRVLAAYKPRTATTRWPPRNRIRAAHRGITARAIHPGHAGPAGTPPGQTMLVRFVGRSFSTTSASSIINKCHQERGVNEAEPLDT